MLIKGYWVVLGLDMERRSQSRKVMRFRHEEISLFAVDGILVRIDAILNIVGEFVFECN